MFLKGLGTNAGYQAIDNIDSENTHPGLGAIQNYIVKVVDACSRDKRADEQWWHIDCREQYC